VQPDQLEHQHICPSSKLHADRILVEGKAAAMGLPVDFPPIEIDLVLIVATDFQPKAGPVRFTLEITDRVGHGAAATDAIEIAEIEHVIILPDRSPVPGPGVEPGFLRDLFLVQRLQTLPIRVQRPQDQPLLNATGILGTEGSRALRGGSCSRRKTSRRSEAWFASLCHAVTCLAVAASQTMAVLSSLAVTIRWPSGEKATE